MSLGRFIESKVLEHDDRLDHMLTDIKKLKDDRTGEDIVRIQMIPIEFHPDKYKLGESALNKAIDDGFEINRDFPTESGVVIRVAKWKKKVEPNE
jgi:hypothetical protein